MNCRYVSSASTVLFRFQFLTLFTQNQESYYNSKVDDVKAEHQKLLTEAFEKAKVCRTVTCPF